MWRIGGYLVLCTELGYLFAGKVCPIVGDGLDEPEATHDVLPKEFDNLLSSDLGEWRRLDQFGEVVDGYKEEPQLRLSSGSGLTISNPYCMKGQGLCKVWRHYLWYCERLFI